jgi:hypothetical protein
MNHSARPFKAYLAGLAGFLLVSLGGLASFNFIVDPYSFFNLASIEGVNQYKTYGRKIRLRKPIHVYLRKPSVVILGSSRGGRGLQCKDLVIDGKQESDCYNASIRGITPYESYRMLEHSIGVGQVEHLVLQLSYGTFLERKSYKDSFFEENFTTPEQGISLELWQNLLNRLLYALFSSEAINDSLHTIKFQDKPYGWFSTSIWSFEKDGSWTTYPIQLAIDDPAWAASKEQKGWGLASNAMMKNFKKFRKKIDKDPEHFDYNYHFLREQLRLAHQHGIETNLMVPPSHIEYLDIVYRAGLWQHYQQWKRNLVKLNREVAQEFGKAPFPLWDFSGFNQYTMEPSWEDLKAGEQMRWYVDVVHFNEKIGHKLLSAISNKEYSSSWYTLLEQDNIESHIHKHNQLGKKYFPLNSKGN